MKIIEPISLICDWCGEIIDVTVCWCGVDKNHHGPWEGHTFVPMGCRCYFGDSHEVKTKEKD